MTPDDPTPIIETWPSPAWAAVALTPCARHGAEPGEPCWPAIHEDAPGGSALCGSRIAAAWSTFAGDDPLRRRAA